MMASVSTYVWERPATPSSHPDVRQFSSSPYASGAFQAAAPVLVLRGSESEEVHVGAL